MEGCWPLMFGEGEGGNTKESPRFYICTSPEVDISGLS